MNVSEPQTVLLLIPTAFEKNFIPADDLAWCTENNLQLEVVGFGPVAAAARTSQLLAQFRPRQTILMGIAGSFRQELVPGTATRFSEVSMFGIGRGSGESFQSASSMGWAQIAIEDETIHDRLEITHQGPEALLLTTCSASLNASDAAQKLRVYPDATAEDMEGFGVAMACRLAGCPLQIIRGISNFVGEIDKSKWQIEPAMLAATRLVRQIIEEGRR